MKRISLLIPSLVLTLLLLGVCSSAVASEPSTPDGSWFWQLAGSGNGFTAVACTDASHGWVVGLGGTILATSDGGATWVNQDSGTSDVLTGVSFPDATHGWAVSAHASILATSDGGSSWSLQDTGPLPGNFLTGVTFVDALHGWAVGGLAHISGEDEGFIIATSDGGAHWSSQLSGLPAALRAVDFADVTHGIAVGDGGIIYRTTDGGAHWLPTSAPVSDGPPYRGVSYPDASHAWATGYRYIIASQDGGKTWKVQHDSGSTAVGQSVSFADSLHGCTTGLCTKDGGATWHKYNADLAPLSAVVLADASHGWAVGGNLYSWLDPYQVILATATGGFGTAPTTRLASPLWQNGGVTHTATWKLVATPDPSVGSVLRTEYLFDSGDVYGEWTVGTKLTLPAPSDHSGDGWHGFAFRSVGGDDAVEAYTSVNIGIDTCRPTTRAPYACVVRRYQKAKLQYWVSDPLPNGGTATVTVKIKNRHGTVVRTLGPYRGVTTGVSSLGVYLIHTATFTCKLAKGTYRFYVYAPDAAGNAQTLPAGNNRLVVR
jgi:photosystem II stability/assembly factor-like uncharacterized protein